MDCRLASSVSGCMILVEGSHLIDILQSLQGNGPNVFDA